MSPRLSPDQINEREPAFARPATMINENLDYAVNGLSKLEYAAIHIAAGLATNTEFRFGANVELLPRVAVSIARKVLAEATKD